MSGSNSPQLRRCQIGVVTYTSSVDRSAQKLPVRIRVSPPFKMTERKTHYIDKRCLICGDEFKVRVHKISGKILTKCFYSKMPKRFFLRWNYRIIRFEGSLKTEPVFDNLFWKVVGYTSLQRTIVYWCWKKIFGRKTIEYWECKKCCSTD